MAADRGVRSHSRYAMGMYYMECRRRSTKRDVLIRYRYCEVVFPSTMLNIFLYMCRWVGVFRFSQVRAMNEGYR